MNKEDKENLKNVMIILITFIVIINIFMSCFYMWKYLDIYVFKTNSLSVYEENKEFKFENKELERKIRKIKDDFLLETGEFYEKQINNTK